MTNDDAIPYEPKRKNRFVVTLPIEFGLPSWLISNTSRPTIIPKYSKMEINGVFHRTIIANDWQPIDMVFRDPVNPSTTRTLWELFTGLSQVPLGMDEKIFAVLKEKFKPFKSGFDYTLDMLDPTGISIEKWLVSCCHIISVDFGNLTDSGDLVSCKITIQPTNAILLY